MGSSSFCRDPLSWPLPSFGGNHSRKVARTEHHPFEEPANARARGLSHVSPQADGILGVITECDSFRNILQRVSQQLPCLLTCSIMSSSPPSVSVRRRGQQGVLSGIWRQGPAQGCFRLTPPSRTSSHQHQSGRSTSCKVFLTHSRSQHKY